MKKFIFKGNVTTVVYAMLVAVFMWAVISTTIQRFKCTKLTETEIFIRIPKSFVCDWVNCD